MIEYGPGVTDIDGLFSANRRMQASPWLTNRFLAHPCVSPVPGEVSKSRGEYEEFSLAHVIRAGATHLKPLRKPFSDEDSAKSSIDSGTPSIQEQIHALPRHLLDSDSESEYDESEYKQSTGTPPSSIDTSSTPATPNSAALSNPSTSMDRKGLVNVDCVRHASSHSQGSSPSQCAWTHLPAVAGSLLKHDVHGQHTSMSVDAAPFVPRMSPASGSVCNNAGPLTGERTSQELVTALATATSFNQLLTLVADYGQFFDATCIVTAMQRLVKVHSTGGESAAIAAEVTMSIANMVGRVEIPDAATVIMIQGLLAVDAEVSVVPLTKVVRCCAEKMQRQPTPQLRLYCATAAALRHLTPLVSNEELATTCANLGRCATRILACTPLCSIPVDAIQEMAYGLQLNSVLSPDLLTTISHAACLHASCLPCSSIVMVLQLLVSYHSTDSATLGTLARAFHESTRTWQVQDCLSFFSMCRSYKPLLAAQRQQSTLVSILDFLMPIITRCTTRELSTLLLDLAFIGCQSFKVHNILNELSTELYNRIKSGALAEAQSVELADAIRALDKLDHCHDDLSRSAGPILARGNLPAKHLANAIVSLARQKYLSPALVVAARELLETNLTACNGQDVSQILFGLMLDKHTVPGATETFRAIAQPLAHHLRVDDSFQAQSVSRILSSYAKVGCHCPLVFEAGTRRLAAHISELKPAFVAELASSLATAGHAEPLFMKRLGGVIKRRFHDYSPSMLCSALWAFSQSRAFHSELFSLSCGKLSNLVSRGQLPYQDISQAMASIATIQFRHNGLLRAVHDWLCTHFRHIPVPSIPPLLAALHTFNMVSDRLLEGTICLLSGNMHMFSAADRGKLCQLVWVLGTCSNVKQHEGLLHSATRQIVQTGGIEDAQLSHLELSQIATGMWPALAPVRASLALGVVAEASAQVEQLTTQQLCDCVSGVAICGLLDKAFMDRAATVLARDAARLGPDQLCRVAAAYARTGTTNHELFVQLTAIAHMHIEQRSLDAAQATVLAWAFTIHGTGSPITISSLFHSVAENVSRLSHSPQDLESGNTPLMPAHLRQLHMAATLAGANSAAVPAAHVASTTGSMLWMDQNPAPTLPAPLAHAAAKVYSESRHQMMLSLRQDDEHMQRLNTTKECLSSLHDITVLSEAPRFCNGQDSYNPLLEYVDVWAQNTDGEPIGVLVLSKLHVLELSSAVQGWVCAICKVLHRLLPHLVVVMPARGYGGTPGVEEQIWAQLPRSIPHT